MRRPLVTKIISASRDASPLRSIRQSVASELLAEAARPA